MAYKVAYRGVVIECETAQEAISIAKELGEGNAGGLTATGEGESDGGDGGRLNTSRYKEFVAYLGTKQKKFLALLVDNPHGKTDSALCQALDLDGNQELGGFGSGISKLARKAGLNMNEILTVEKVMVGGEKKREYKINSTFRKIANQAGGLK